MPRIHPKAEAAQQVAETHQVEGAASLGAAGALVTAMGDVVALLGVLLVSHVDGKLPWKDDHEVRRPNRW